MESTETTNPIYPPQGDTNGSTMTVAVNGATGFIGTHVINELVGRGHTALGLVRKSANPNDLEVLKSIGATTVSVDLQQDSSLAGAMKGCTCLVHLIGSIAPKRGTRLEDLHRGIAKRFFDAAIAAGVSKVIMVSALGADRDAPSTYHRTKWEAEETLRQSRLTFVVLRPSLVVGRSVGHRDSKMVRRYIDLIHRKKKVPLVLGGRNLVQPIFVGDLARAVCAAIEKPTWDNQTLELGGGEVMVTRDFIVRLMKALDIEKGFVTIPGPIAWCAALLLESIQEVPLLSRDQLKIAAMDGNCHQNALTEQFGLDPRPLDEVLRIYRETPGKEIAS